MSLGVHCFVHLDHGAVRSDDVGDTFGGFVSGRFAGAVGDAERAIGVTEQREGELLLVSEFGVRAEVVGADAEDLDVSCFVVVDSNTESMAFRCSATGAGFGVEPHDHGSAGVVAEFNGGSGMVEDFEIGGPVSNIEHSMRLQVNMGRSGEK